MLRTKALDFVMEKAEIKEVKASDESQKKEEQKDE
jgi:hypothetical protein